MKKLDLKLLFLIFITIFCLTPGILFLSQSAWTISKENSSTRVCYSEELDFRMVCLETRPFPTKEESPSYIYLNPFNEKNNFPNTQNPSQYVSPLNVIDLSTASPELQLTPYFKLGDLMLEEKGAYGLFSPTAFKALSQMRALTSNPFLITSAYRSPAYNEKVGGAKWSRHKYGDAVDLISNDLTEIKDLCRENGGYSLTYQTHLHCDWRHEPLDRAFFPLPLISRISKLKNQNNYINITITPHNEQIHIEIDVDIIEDPEPIKIKWTVYSPIKAIIYGSGHHIILPAESTPYFIEVTIGEQIIKIFEVKP